MRLQNTFSIESLGFRQARRSLSYLIVLKAAAAMTFAAAGQPCSLRQEPTGSTRSVSRMAYDSDRGVTVMFGGKPGWAYYMLNDTLEWDGQSWKPRTVIGPSPSPRFAHAMAYDHDRKVTILFGGQISAFSYEYSGETWEWDGEEWTLRSNVGPLPRGYAGMAYDSHRKRTVLFGGLGFPDRTTGEPLDDTWEWDGTSWMEIDVTPPVPNVGSHQMAFDSRRGVTVQFRNQAGTWEYDGQQWRQAQVNGPPNRGAHQIAFDSKRGVIVMHAGATSTQPLDDLWEFDGESWRQRASSGVPRSFFGMAYDSWRGACVVFGIYPQSGSYDQTMEWDGDQWIVRDTVPAEDCQSMAFHEASAKTIVLQRFNSASMIVWKWDGTNWARDKVAPFTAPNQTAMAYDSHRKVLVVAGIPNSGTWHDTWEYDGTNWSLIQTPLGPSSTASYIHSTLAYDSAREITVLYTGSETWEWNGHLWKQSLSKDYPPIRLGHCMAYDPVRQKTVMAGGRDGNGIIHTDTWEWDGDNWHYRGDNQSVGSFNSMVFHAGMNRLLRFGWVTPSQVKTAFHWSGEEWIPIPVVDPLHPHSDLMSFDTVRGTVVAYANYSQQTYELRDNPSAPGDITCDGVVNVNDLLMIINSWGPCPAPPQSCPADISPPGPPSGDGVVNVNDLLMVIRGYP